MFRKFITCLILSFSLSYVSAAVLPADSSRNDKNNKNDYAKITKKATLERQGVFTVYESEKKWYLEIPDTLLNRYFLTVTRLITSPVSFPMYGGEKLNEQTVYFEKGNADRLFLRSVDYRQEAPENDAIYGALLKSQQQPIIAALDIKGTNQEENTYLVEVTDLFRKDNSVLSLASKIKSDNKLGSLADDRSFIIDMRTFPINLEVQTTKTYSTSSPSVDVGAQTFTVNTSMVLLPKVPMQKRLADQRIGYFANRFTHFADDKPRSETHQLIQRFRLEPKDEDMARYKRGEKVDPKKQIVYYIDPATPKKWRPYLIAGINDWNKAFEQAGFKNAIVGREWPESDTTMSLEDARFSVIRYFASEKSNAYGPRIVDPRSGEIIESHVGWYHNVMKLLQQWFMVQAGPLDKRAQKMDLDDEVMGQLIRFVSSHEVGHGLGLRHNMGASSQTPVEKLRDKDWLERHGHTVSIMDYARFNYVAQPEDNVGLAGIYPRIGMYDKWAIQWGYQYLPQFKDAYHERDFLVKQLTDSLERNPKLWFGGEGKGEDPRSQSEDLGDDAVLASTYGLKNLRRVIDNLVEWTATPNDDYTNLKNMHKAVRSQFNRYLYHVLKNIGNRYVTEKVRGDEGAVYAEVPKARVKAAVQYVNDHVFTPPMWLYPADIRQYLGNDDGKEILDQQQQMLNMLLSPGMMHNLYQKSLTDKDIYPLEEYLEDLAAGVWTALDYGKEANAYKRSQQRYFLEKIDVLINGSELDGKNAVISQAQRSDVQLYVSAFLPALQQRIQQLTMKAKAPLDKQHFRQALEEIKRIQERKDK